MKQLRSLFVILFCLVTLVTTAQVPFTPGNLVVCRIGDGSTALSSNAHPVFLDEYTPTGALVQSIALPVVPSGANNPLVLPDDDFQLGTLTLSADGRYLALNGYNAAVGTTTGVLQDATITQRTNALIDYNAVINTATSLTNTGGTSPYCLVTSNGTDMWGGYATGGLRYSQSGNTNSTQISSTNNFRRVIIRNGQLFASISSGGVVKVGAGLPTSGSASLTVLTGTTALGAKSEFVFADMDPTISGDDVMYLVSPGTAALRKYSLIGTTWTSNGTIGLDSDDYGSITAVINGTNATLYIVRKVSNFGTNPNGGGEIVTLTDNVGYSTLNNSFTGTPTVIVPDIAGSNKAFRGIAMVPTPPSVSVSVKAYLQGAYSTTTSRHKDVTTAWAAVLNANATSQPYSVAPFNYTGTESVTNGFFTTTGDGTDVVDWVLLELRDSTNPASVLKQRAAFIREDGMIVDIDGSPDVNFNKYPPYINAGNYYVVVRHRNHLSVRSASTLALSTSSTSYDFTTAQSQAYQNPANLVNGAMASKDLPGNIPNVFMLWAGNANSDNAVRAGGGPTISDYLTIMSSTALDGSFTKIINSVYRKEDLNMDGLLRAGGGPTLSDYLTLLSSGVLDGSFTAIISAHL